jgi:hypothetical protein
MHPRKSRRHPRIAVRMGHLTVLHGASRDAHVWVVGSWKLAFGVDPLECAKLAFTRTDMNLIVMILRFTASLLCCVFCFLLFCVLSFSTLSRRDQVTVCWKLVRY